MSLGELEIFFSFVGQNKTVKGEIIRYQAPLIVQKLMDNSPMTVRSRINVGSTKSYVILFVNIKKGMEKEAAKTFNVGDIVYSPQQDALFLIFAKTSLPTPVKYIGKIVEGLEHLATISMGTNIKIEFKPKNS